MPTILYQGGYKYQLARPYTIEIPIKPEVEIHNRFISLDTAGLLVIRVGYAWDGPSGPTFDTKNFMRGSLVHDALYQLFREQRLDHKTHRKTADEILRQLCIEDGMSSVRAWWVYNALRLVGEATATNYLNKVLTAT